MMKQLDRALGSTSWELLYLEVYVEVLRKMHSNHFPLLISYFGQEKPRGERPFRFLAAWTTHPAYDSMVEAA